jgi:hypothetical protein
MDKNMSWLAQQHFKIMMGRVVYDPATAIMIGLSVASAASQQSAAKKQAKATIAEGNIVAANKAKEVARKAATQRVSFLNSGVTLDGTPMNVIESTFNTGLEDINQISSNYNTAAKNQIAAGRSAAIQSLAGGLSNVALPSMSNIGSGIGNVASGWSSTGVAPQQWPAPVTQY